MPGTVNFGTALKRFRSERTLSLRELGVLSDVDHAYIHRLESGDKDDPSPDVFDKLARGLKLTIHRRKLLELLMVVPEMDANLFKVALRQPERFEAVRAAAQMSFRGPRPQSEAEWEEKLTQIEDLLGHARG